MRYTEAGIDELYQANKALAISALATIPVALGADHPSIRGLNGWVFEQTIRFCLQEELTSLGIALLFKEQASLGGRAKADLLVGGTAIEIKTGGIFGKGDSERYRKYVVDARNLGLSYIYITLNESHKPYYDETVAIFGPGGSFFLREPGAWQRFVKAVVTTNGGSLAASED